MKTLQQQLFNAIDSNFNPGSDKHSIKKEKGIGGTDIFSYADKNALKDFAKNFSNFIKIEEPGLKMVKNLNPEIAQKFIDQKAADGCSLKTLEQYKSKFNKIERLINHRYGTAEVSLSTTIPTDVDDNKLRDIAMDKSHLDAYFKFCEATNSKSLAPLAIEMASRFGLRVAETCKIMPMDLRGETLHIHESKGGRSRDILISKEDAAWLKSVFESHEKDKRFITIKEDSVNKHLARVFEKLGIEDYKNAKTGVHSIRKMVAQEYYDKCRETMSNDEALKKTSVFLGHGEDRKNLMASYVLKIRP